MNTFLPRNYEQPVTQGNYTKLIKGENTIRIMSSAIVGYEYWTRDNKPVRQKEAFEFIPNDARLEEGTFKPKHFWAFCVWNYKTNSVQIMQVTQKTIQSDIKALVDNEKWGDPKLFDLTITRRGDGLETEYTTMPNPHSPTPQEAKTAYDKANINLEALYSGADPFNAPESHTDAPTEDFTDPPAHEEPSVDIDYPTESSEIKAF